MSEQIGEIGGVPMYGLSQDEADGRELRLLRDVLSAEAWIETDFSTTPGMEVGMTIRHPADPHMVSMYRTTIARAAKACREALER